MTTEQKWSRHEIEDFEHQFKKILANPDDRLGVDHPQWHRPYIGDHVRISSWDTQINVQECVRVSKLPYLTVKEVIPMLVGIDEFSGYWSYSVRVEETNLEFLQWHYEILTC